MNAPITFRFENAQAILRVENMANSLRFYVDQLGFKNAPGEMTISPALTAMAPVFISAAEARGEVEHRPGLAWKMQKNSTRNPNRKACPYACPRPTTRGRLNSMLKIQTAMYCALVQSQSNEHCVSTGFAAFGLYPSK
jgi:hypothetical protein